MVSDFPGKPHFLSFYWIPFTHPFGKSCLEGENVCIPKAFCRDRGLHARISPRTPAVKHKNCILFGWKDELEGIKLFFWNKQ